MIIKFTIYQWLPDDNHPDKGECGAQLYQSSNYDLNDDSARKVFEKLTWWVVAVELNDQTNYTLFHKSKLINQWNDLRFPSTKPLFTLSPRTPLERLSSVFAEHGLKAFTVMLVLLFVMCALAESKRPRLYKQVDPEPIKVEVGADVFKNEKPVQASF